MKRFCCWLLMLGTPLASLAQQLLCERELRVNAPRNFSAPLLLRLQADSLRLLSNYYPNAANGNHVVQTRVTRLNLAQCDTLPTRAATLALWGRGSQDNVAATTRRGQVLIAKGLSKLLPSGATDSSRIVLRLLNRDGTTRWHRLLPPQARFEGVSGILEAPQNGFFMVGGEFHPAPSPGPGRSYSIVLRLDSAGRELWRRRYSPALNGGLENPTYTRNGTFVCTTDFTTPSAPPRLTLMEFNQQGDSLTSRQTVIVQQQATRVPFNVPNTLSPLRDGGFAVVGQVDSANTGYFRPFLARLDRNLNLTWSYVYRAQAAQYLQFAQPQELADGSVVVVASNLQSGRNYPFWLFRFAATGALQQRYPFVSQVLTANTNSGRTGFFGVAQGLQPLSDSTFVLAAGGSDVNSSRIYLAHLRVPGLPRVIDSHFIPPAQPLAAHPGRAAGAGLALFPNPATETVTVRYAAPAGGPPAVLVLCDVLGRVVRTQPLPAGGATLSVRALPAGLYQATVWAGGRAVAGGRLAVGR